MHRFRTRQAIRRFRLAAVLFLLELLIICSIVTGTAMWAAGDDPRWMMRVALLLGSLFPLIILQWSLARRTQCPLCMARVMASKHCVTHRRARRWFFSHRLPVAVHVVFTNRFDCPYCHERSALKIRGQSRRKPKSRHP